MPRTTASTKATKAAKVTKATKATRSAKATTAGTAAKPTTSGNRVIPEVVESANEQLRDAARSLREAIAELHATEGDAWRTYSDDVNEALLHMNAHLEVANAALRAARSETRDDLTAALREAANARYGIVDQLRVQTRLGAMEARDRTEDAKATLNQMGQRIEAVIETVRNDTEHTWNDLVHDTADAIGNLRHAVRGLFGPA